MADYSDLKLIWTQRQDLLWTAHCACGIVFRGVEGSVRRQTEYWHFKKAKKMKNYSDSCGPIGEPEWNKKI